MLPAFRQRANSHKQDIGNPPNERERKQQCGPRYLLLGAVGVEAGEIPYALRTLLRVVPHTIGGRWVAPLHGPQIWRVPPKSIIDVP